MGKIPEYRRSQFRSSADTGAVNRAASQIGQPTFGQMAYSGAVNILEKQRAIQENEYLTTKGLEFELKAQELKAAHEKKYEGDPVGKYGEFQKEYSKLQKEFTDAAPTRDSRRRFSSMTNQFGMKLEHNNKQWEIKRLGINNGEKAQNGLETIQVQALRVSDPRAMGTLAKKGKAFLDTLKETHTPEQIEEAREKFEFNAALNSFEGLVGQGKYVDAQELLDSKEYDSYLGDNGIKSVQNLINSQRKVMEREKADFERLKFASPYKYLEKKKEGLSTMGDDGFFQLGSPSSITNRLKFIDRAQAQNPGLELPFFAPDEIKKFKEDFERGSNTDRLNFLNEISKTPADQADLYDQMGVPQEISFYSSFKDNQDQELFIQATMAKDIKPTDDTRSADIKMEAESSSFGKVLLDASSSVAQNSSFRRSTQNLMETMKRISILKNDPKAGPEFFEKNFTVINDGDPFFSDNATMIYVPNDIDQDLLEDKLKESKQKIIEAKVKGLDSTASYNMKRHIEENTTWLNGPDGPVLVDNASGKMIDTPKSTRVSFESFRKAKPKNRVVFDSSLSMPGT